MEHGAIEDGSRGGSVKANCTPAQLESNSHNDLTSPGPTVQDEATNGNLLAEKTETTRAWYAYPLIDVDLSEVAKSAVRFSLACVAGSLLCLITPIRSHLLYTAFAPLIPLIFGSGCPSVGRSLMYFVTVVVGALLGSLTAFVLLQIGQFYVGFQITFLLTCFIGFWWRLPTQWRFARTYFMISFVLIFGVFQDCQMYANDASLIPSQQSTSFIYSHYCSPGQFDVTMVALLASLSAVIVIVAGAICYIVAALVLWPMFRAVNYHGLIVSSMNELISIYPDIFSNISNRSTLEDNAIAQRLATCHSDFSETRTWLSEVRLEAFVHPRLNKKKVEIYSQLGEWTSTTLNRLRNVQEALFRSDVNRQHPYFILLQPDIDRTVQYGMEVLKYLLEKSVVKMNSKRKSANGVSAHDLETKLQQLDGALLAFNVDFRRMFASLVQDRERSRPSHRTYFSLYLTFYSLFLLRREVYRLSHILFPELQRHPPAPSNLSKELSDVENDLVIDIPGSNDVPLRKSRSLSRRSFVKIQTFYSKTIPLRKRFYHAFITHQFKQRFFQGLRVVLATIPFLELYLYRQSLGDLTSPFLMQSNFIWAIVIVFSVNSLPYPSTGGQTLRVFCITVGVLIGAAIGTVANLVAYDNPYFLGVLLFNFGFLGLYFYNYSKYSVALRYAVQTFTVICIGLRRTNGAQPNALLGLVRAIFVMAGALAAILAAVLISPYQASDRVREKLAESLRREGNVFAATIEDVLNGNWRSLDVRYKKDIGRISRYVSKIQMLLDDIPSEPMNITWLSSSVRFAHHHSPFYQLSVLRAMLEHVTALQFEILSMHSVMGSGVHPKVFELILEKMQTPFVDIANYTRDTLIEIATCIKEKTEAKFTPISLNESTFIIERFIDSFRVTTDEMKRELCMKKEKEKDVDDKLEQEYFPDDGLFDENFSYGSFVVFVHIIERFFLVLNDMKTVLTVSNK